MIAKDKYIKQYQNDLFVDYLPFLENHIIDHENGGFMCHANWKGELLDRHKRAWFDGRGIWVYSFLYSHVKKDVKYLDVAAKTVDLVFSNRPTNQEFWPWMYDEKGNDLELRAPDIYGNLFIAEGLTAYSQAIDDMAYWNLAKDITMAALNKYDAEDYSFVPHYESDLSQFKAPRVLGHWMVFLRIASQLLAIKEDSELLALTDRCIKSLLDHHLESHCNLMVEYRHHDLSAMDEPWNDFVYIGHGIEVAWMIMEEAIRREDKGLYDKAKSIFRRHLEVAWDDVYGGVFHECQHIGKNDWILDKLLWAQEEVLVGLMLIIEHSSDQWAIEWFEKAYQYTVSHFSLAKYDIPLWNIGGNRWVDFDGTGIRIENYHHPRHLMINLLRLQRL
ncbi:AGE family epimerase/isomerase [Membranihabitans marinus]|uniref:AGE family epimerase/isomerase n=1 Tax=Membranihabitans marinus TaxID=1227546 RepID=UPI001F379443|nr:AGE family epimerase/isomerase [Membranihabitans marinus]